MTRLLQHLAQVGRRAVIDMGKNQDVSHAPSLKQSTGWGRGAIGWARAGEVEMTRASLWPARVQTSGLPYLLGNTPPIQFAAKRRHD